MSAWMTILGAFACGKTTLARGLLGAEPRDLKHDLHWEKPIPCAQSADAKTWLGGNLKSGMDGFPKSQEALVLLFGHARQHCELMVTDSPRASASFNVDWARASSGFDKLIYVYYDVPEEENLRRFVERRKALGKDPEVTASTLQTIRDKRKNASMVWRRAQDAWRHNDDRRMSFVTVAADMDARVALQLVSSHVNAPGVAAR